jgi:hypothetical protein
MATARATAERPFLVAVARRRLVCDADPLRKLASDERSHGLSPAVDLHPDLLLDAILVAAATMEEHGEPDEGERQLFDSLRLAKVSAEHLATAIEKLLRINPDAAEHLQRFVQPQELRKAALAQLEVMIETKPRLRRKVGKLGDWAVYFDVECMGVPELWRKPYKSADVSILGAIVLELPSDHGGLGKLVIAARYREQVRNARRASGLDYWAGKSLKQQLPLAIDVLTSGKWWLKENTHEAAGKTEGAARAKGRARTTR